MAGTQEPIYGPSAIRSVAEQAKETPYTELTKDDLKWVAMESTCVETQTFYLMADNGLLGMAQVIYSNVAYDDLVRWYIPVVCSHDCAIVVYEQRVNSTLRYSTMTARHRIFGRLIPSPTMGSTKTTYPSTQTTAPSHSPMTVQSTQSSP